MSKEMEVCTNYFTLPFIFYERIDGMDYPSNANMSSGQATGDQVKVNSAISSTPKVKPSTAKGVKGFVLQQDFNDIKEGVVNDIIRPKIKELIYDTIEGILNTVSSSFQMMIFGDVRYKSGPKIGDRVSYNNYSKNKTQTPSISSSFVSDSINYESRGEAEMVLEAMKRHLEEYPVVTVAQMYEFSNLKTPNWTTTTFGWTDLSGATVRRDYDGDYIIDLPRAKPIGR